jgi:replication factor A1
MSEDISEVPVVKLAEVKPFQNRFKTIFKVVEKSEEREVQNKNNPDETHRMSDVTVADETASIILTAWDDDINLLEDGKFFSLTNGYVNLFKSSMRLARSKYGVIDSVEDEFEINSENNRSEEEHQARRRSRGPRRDYGDRDRRSNLRF